MKGVQNSVLNFDFTAPAVTSSTGHAMEAVGRNRIVTIDGINAFHPISATSYLKLPTDQHLKEFGTIVL